MMKNKFKAFWDRLSSKQRRNFVTVMVGCALIGFSLLGYLATKGKTEPTANAKQTKDLSIETKLLEKSQILESQKDMARKDEENRLLKQQMEAIKNGAAGAGNMPMPVASPTPIPGHPPVPGQPIPVAQEKGAQAMPEAIAAGRKGAMGSVAFSSPPPPSMKGTLPLPPLPPLPAGDQSGQAVPPPETEIGDISLVSSGVQTKTPPADDKKKEMTAMYLPPSFMEAILLSGLDAPTSSDAKGNPVPALLKVKTPAFLPNSVRADLKGCYVIADGKGNLATERAELLLVSLSCLDRKGRAVIDQKVKGFVVDQDSKIGLRGRVVAKMGSMIARSMIAGFFGGVGDVVRSSATTTAISPLGTTQTVSAGDLAKAGIGSGLANGFKDMEKFYMELAHQTMPVIEVSAAKPVTLVISEGVNLEIKKLRKGGVK